jgi:tRNA dimethylallyltransferase
MNKPKVVVIVGPTASGKTSLSIELATRFHGEIVSADSRQVYRGLDLGTGKVTKEEMDGVPHHLIDVADPKVVYTASDFVRDGRKAIVGIHERGNLPIIAGGSFFYVDALLGRVTLPEVPPDETLRAELDAKSTPELYEMLAAHDTRRAESIDKDNRRRLIRAIEISGRLGAVPLPRSEPLYDVLILGIDIEKEELHANIHARLIARIEAGMLEEVKRLHENGLSYDRLESLGLEYRYIARHLRGELPYCEMLTVLETKIRQFAKRQMTWLKRDAEIKWVDRSDKTSIENLIQKFLEK